MHRQLVALTLVPTVVIGAVVAVGVLSAVIRPKPPVAPRRDKTGPRAGEQPLPRHPGRHDH